MTTTNSKKEKFMCSTHAEDKIVPKSQEIERRTSVLCVSGSLGRREWG